MARRARAWVSAAGLATAAATASATWSIVIVDTRTGEVGVASATCLTGFDLQANTPVLLTGIGAATAQSSVDSTGANRTYIRDGLIGGVRLTDILAGLAGRDGTHQSRQYGMAATTGEALTFSGTSDGAWAGGRTGRVGDLVYAVQGNVLTGAPVVDRAVEAIEGTSGDLAARLMAGMEAARLMGGDGRCSCLPNDPDGCGSPPPTFEKSAHIAYMLIARAGDVWDCRAAYRVQGAADIQLIDGDGDGVVDAYTGVNANPAGLAGLRGLALRGYVRLADPAVSPAGGAVRAMARGDFDGDGRDDLAGMVTANDRVSFLRGGPGGFAVQGTTLVGRSPVAIIAADLNADGRLDVATVNSGNGDASALLGRGDGTFAAAVNTTLGLTPVGLAAGDFNGDGRMDLATLQASTRSVVVLAGDGSGAFTPTTVRSGLAFAPGAILARDLDGDGRPELLVCGGAGILEIRDIADAGRDRSFATTSTANAMEVADADGDGTPDLFCSSSGGVLSVFRGLGGGDFAAPAAAPMGFTSTKFAVRDMDGDGDADVVYIGSGTVVVMSNLAGPGRMPAFENAGCASGSGYMEFNVANQRAGDPDPVFQLRAMYDAWRAGLAGAPDAVRTTAEWIPRSNVPADGRARRSLRVTLRDLEGAAVDGPWTVEARSRAGVAATIEGVTQVGPGVFEVAVRAGRACGEASVEVVVGGPGRSVTLMPAPVLTHLSAADANDDGFVDFFDYDDFLARFEAGDSSADADGDGAVTPADYDAFLAAFERGC